MAATLEEARYESQPKAGKTSFISMACKLNAEIQAVLAVMRQNEKWGPSMPHYYDEQDADDPLLRDFKLLRKRLFSTEDWKMLTPAVYLAPFLAVIRSEKTNILITGAALTAIRKVLTLELFGASEVEAQQAMHAIIDAVTACRFEVTDQVSEEIVLMKVLQVLSTCLKCSAGKLLSDRDVCSVINTCFRVLHQSAGKGELFQRVACVTMQEMIRCVFGRLPNLREDDSVDEGSEAEGVLAYVREGASGNEETSSTANGRSLDEDGKRVAVGANGAVTPSAGSRDAGGEKIVEVGVRPIPDGHTGASNSGFGEQIQGGDGKSAEHGVADWNGAEAGSGAAEEHHVVDAVKTNFVGKPHGIACMVEIFHLLCSLLSLEDQYLGEGSGGEEDMPLFALGLVNSAVELGGEDIAKHPKLLSLVQDELFRNLMQLGLSSNVLVLSLVCSIVRNLFHTLRVHLKLQIEAFFSFVVVRLAQGKYGAPFQQQEVVLELLVDFCRQPSFIIEMFANYDCDITCSNTFEELTSLLSKSAFPVNSPLSTLHVLALEGLLAVVQSIADRLEASPPGPAPSSSFDISEISPFWTIQMEKFENSARWVEHVRRQKHIKRRLMLGADHFNRDPKKGLLYLQNAKLLPKDLDPHSVACFFRYTPGLNKTLLGEYFGDPNDFNVHVLHEYTNLFDFKDMTVDAALRTFLESFRLPGEAQKISRVLESFAERYHKQCPAVLANKDAVFVFCYSVIMLNTDLHNAGVKRKMTEEEFIRNNRDINDGKAPPREMMTELYHSIAKNEIRMSQDGVSGVPEMTYSRWIDLMRRSRTSIPYTICTAVPLFDRDMFASISGPTIAAISVVFDHTEDEEILQQCVDGFMAVAKISTHHRLEDVLNDLVVSLCKFTTLLNPTGTAEEPSVAFGEDAKARMALSTVFATANKHGDFIRNGWRNILDCVLRLHKLGLLPAKIGSEMDDAVEGEIGGDVKAPMTSVTVLNPLSMRRRPSGIMSRFSQLLSLDNDDQHEQPTEQQLAAHRRTLSTIEACHIDTIFADSRFLLTDSLMQLVNALIWAGGRPQRGGNNFSQEDEDTAVFCLELLISVTLNNRDRILLLWPTVSDHIAGIVQGASTPGPLVKKAVLGLLRICQRLLPYKEELADELLRSLQLIQKLDAKVADLLCEKITQEVLQLVRGNAAHIRSPQGWKTVCSLLGITARHPEAAEAGFEGLSFIMAEGAHVTQANYVPCLDAAREFAEVRVGGVERSVWALDLLAGLLICLQKWSVVAEEAKGTQQVGNESESPVRYRKEEQELADMWLRLAQAIRRVCGEPREEVRNHAVMCLQRCLLAAESIKLPAVVWGPCFDQVIFVMLDDLLDIAMREKPKEYKGMEGTLYQALKLLSKVFLHFLGQLSSLPGAGFRALWLAVLSRMEMYLKAKLKAGVSEQLQENIPELLKNMLLVMHAKGILKEEQSSGGDSLWELTWHHVHGISPTLKRELFPPPPPPEPVTQTQLPGGGVSEGTENQQKAEDPPHRESAPIGS